MFAPSIFRTGWKAVARSFQQSPFGKHAGNHLGVETRAYFRLPDLRRNQPFAFGAHSLAPARAVIDRPRIWIIQKREPALAMLFDKEPHLLDSLPDFSWFRSAAPVNPLPRAPMRPQRVASPSCQGTMPIAVARSPATAMRPEPLGSPINLAVRTCRNVGAHEVCNQDRTSSPVTSSSISRRTNSGPAVP